MNSNASILWLDYCAGSRWFYDLHRVFNLVFVSFWQFTLWQSLYDKSMKSLWVCIIHVGGSYILHMMWELYKRTHARIQKFFPRDGDLVCRGVGVLWHIFGNFIMQFKEIWILQRDPDPLTPFLILNPRMKFNPWSKGIPAKSYHEDKIQIPYVSILISLNVGILVSKMDEYMFFCAFSQQNLEWLFTRKWLGFK